MNRPRFGSASAEDGTLPEALERAAGKAVAQLDGATPDVAFLFVSPAYGADQEGAGARLRELTGARHLLGCSGGGVLESRGEIERGRVLSLLVGTLPGATLATFDVRHDELLTNDRPDALRDEIGFPVGSAPTVITFADPFTLDADLLLARLAAAYEHAPAVGGLASGGMRPGAHVLYRDDDVSRFGAVGLAVSGANVRAVVSQGCRPVGRRFVITRADSNKVITLSGRPALEAIQETVASLSAADQELARTNLLFGRVTHEAQAEFGQGDFLVRNLIGAVPDEGAVVVGDRVRVGQTVQLQLRDRTTATDDLDRALRDAAAEGAPPTAALAFCCAGRGRALFGAQSHDVRALRNHLGDIPLAGFFCNGEIGRIGNTNFVHGFTASIALF